MKYRKLGNTGLIVSELALGSMQFGGKMNMGNLGQAVSSVIIAARTAEHLEDNIKASDLQLSAEDIRLLDAASDPGIPYPKWMVLQLDTAEDPRSRILYPERYAQGGPWKDLRGTRWSGG